MDSPANPSEISVLTLNCWGLKYLSALRNERLAEIGRRLARLAEGRPEVDDGGGGDEGAAGAGASAGAGAGGAGGAVPLSIVGLQECWCSDDFDAIRRATAHVLPHAHFFRAGAWGAGLAVLSRWPIEATSMTPYALNGRPTAFWRGDWFVAKGVASATVRPPGARAAPIEVLVTHTHAPYEADQPFDSYLLHQLAQTWTVGKRMRAAAAAAAADGRLVLALGDFNMTPLSLPYQMLFLGAGTTADAPAAASFPLAVRDVWRELHPDSSLGPANHPAERARQQTLLAAGVAGAGAVPSAHTNLVVNGAASDNVLNTWRWPKPRRQQLHKRYAALAAAAAAAGSPASPDEAASASSLSPGHGGALQRPLPVPAEFVVDPETPDPAAKRLDYIFYASAPSSAWSTRTARVAMVEPHATLGCSVSDHYAVQATLQRADGGGSGWDAGAPPAAFAPDSASAGTAAASRAVLDHVLAETARYRARERQQTLWRGLHFFASVAITIGCLVAVWFSPRPFVAFLLMLLSSLGLAAGVVDGLLALLFFDGSELRAVTEFHSEIVQARAALIAHGSGPSSSSADPDKP